MIDLSERTVELIKKVFPEETREEAEELLKLECAENIPFCEDHNEFQMERIRFSVLKLSEGKIDKLVSAIELAQIDWRDLLVAAGFAHDTEAHENWVP